MDEADSSYLDTLNKLGQTAASLIGAAKGNNKATSPTKTAPAPAWLPFAIIGGVLLLLVVVVMSLRK